MHEVCACPIGYEVGYEVCACPIGYEVGYEVCACPIGYEVGYEVSLFPRLCNQIESLVSVVRNFRACQLGLVSLLANYPENVQCF